MFVSCRFWWSLSTCPYFMLQENLVVFVHVSFTLCCEEDVCQLPFLYVQAHLNRTTLSWDSLVDIKFVFLTIS